MWSAERIQTERQNMRKAAPYASWKTVFIPAGQEDAAHALYRLIDTHPSIEIREELKMLLVQGDVTIGYASIPWQEHERPVAELLFMPTDVGLRQLFVVDPKRLLLNKEYSTALKQVMLYHGWIHVKQQREHRFPPWLGIMRLQDEPVPLTPSGMRTFFESEADAFLEECHLAMRIGATNDIPHCRVLDAKGRHAMRLELIKTYALVPSLLPFLVAFTDAAMDED